ncbi:MAG: MMPL family transporter [Acidimicrobiales bacterium]
MLERLARTCYHRRRRVLAAWIVAFVLMGVLGATEAGKYSTNFSVPNTDSQRATDLLDSRFPARAGDTISVIYQAPGGVTAPDVRARAEAVFAQLATYRHVESVISPYSPEGARQVSKDGTIAFASLQLDVLGQDMPVNVTKQMVAQVKKLDAEGGPRFELGGLAVQQSEFQNGGGSEGLGILAAVLILLISFGSVLAMGLPILTAVMGIGIGLAIVELLAHVVNVPNFAPIVAAMIGIGVGIDYALFIVTRYRQGLHRGLDPERATVAAMTTAGRAVLFAGTTVVISVLGMLLMNLPFLEGVAVGSAAAVLITMIGSVTLLPAMLGFAGHAVDKLKVPFLARDEGDHRSGFWFRWSRLVQRRPWPALVAGLVAVVLLAIPIFSLRLGFPGEETTPTSRSSRRAYDLFVAGFGPGTGAPLILAADLRGAKGVATLDPLVAALASQPGVASVSPATANPAGDAAVVQLSPVTGAQDEATSTLVHRLRGSVIPDAIVGTGAKVYVGGPTAAFIDQSASIKSRLPVFIGVVVFLSFLLLMAVFRSILVALKAAIMNLLSIGAAYGVLVAVVQWGWLKGLFGIHVTSPIANFIPMMMFAILFGLSMDYEVFLLSRVREEYVRSGDNGIAVADGLAATARVITAAALIMIMVFLAFVLGPELVIKQIGLGLAAAILIDATLIRMVLVPATMELLGRANWWLPGWLDRMLPTVSFEASEDALEPTPREAAPVGS